MRTSLLIATIVAQALAGIMVHSVAAQQQASRPSGTNVAVVDIGHIFENFSRFKSRMEDIKGDIRKFESHLQSEQRRLQNMQEQLKTFRPDSAEYKELEERMVQTDTNLRLMAARQQKEILEEEARVYYSCYNEVVQHVEAIAQQYGIGLVLRHSREEMEPNRRESVLKGVNRAVVYQNGIDITQHVVDRLNRHTPPPQSADQRQVPLPPRR